MVQGKKIVVVMPAYNAASTIERTYDEVMAQGVVDLVIVVDDGSRDETAAVARSLPCVRLHVHPENRGYGANQKTCYRLAIEAGADVVIMLHPDYQYTPRLIPAMASMVASGLYPCVMGSRILGGQAVRGGMPLWRYVSNRLLTAVENVLTGAKLSEYHSGYRAFASDLLRRLPLEACSNDFVFDNQVLTQVLWTGATVAEVSCPTRYAPESSSISFGRSIVYGFGCLDTAVRYRLARLGAVRSPVFPPALKDAWPKDRRCRPAWVSIVTVARRPARRAGAAPGPAPARGRPRPPARSPGRRTAADPPGGRLRPAPGRPRRGSGGARGRRR